METDGRGEEAGMRETVREKERETDRVEDTSCLRGAKGINPLVAAISGS